MIRFLANAPSGLLAAILVALCGALLIGLQVTGMDRSMGLGIFALGALAILTLVLGPKFNRLMNGQTKIIIGIVIAFLVISVIPLIYVAAQIHE